MAKCSGFSFRAAAASSLAVSAAKERNVAQKLAGNVPTLSFCTVAMTVLYGVTIICGVTVVCGIAVICGVVGVFNIFFVVYLLELR